MTGTGTNLADVNKSLDLHVEKVKKTGMDLEDILFYRKELVSNLQKKIETFKEKSVDIDPILEDALKIYEKRTIGDTCTELSIALAEPFKNI